MKTTIHIVLLCLFCQSTIGQINYNEETSAPKIQKPKPSKALAQLYEEARYLENYGIPLEIEQNRLAIKNEWQTIDPEIAALYKPMKVQGTTEKLEMLEPPNSTDYDKTLPSNRIWGDDLLIHDGPVTGVNMAVGDTGNLYVIGYINEPLPGTNSTFYVYKSIDNGATFSLINERIDGRRYTKIQVFLFKSEQYLVIFGLTDENEYRRIRYDFADKSVASDVLSFDISDFSIDRNFPLNTDNVRLFATYTQSNGPGCDNRVFSARSTAGEFGYGWVDETLVSTICSRALDFAYGSDGATYTAYISTTTGNSYVQSNNNYNDPASWSDEEGITDGNDIQVGKPNICATRKPFASDEVLFIASTRAEGSGDDYNMTVFRRANTAPFVLFDSLEVPNADVIAPSTWIRKEINAEVIQLNYIVREGASTTLETRTYDGTILGAAETISEGNNVSTVSKAIAETQDQVPCLAFSHIIGGALEDIYFNVDNVVLGAEDNLFSNVQYYPNPTSETLTIRSSQIIDKVELYTITGKKVKEFTPNLTEVDLNVQDVSTGIYIATIYSNNQTTNFKLVKN